MNARELFHKDGKPAGVFYCTKCRVSHPERVSAELCCDTRCTKCNAERKESHLGLCDLCFTEEQIKRERARFERSTKIKSKDYEGPVFDGNRFYENVQEAVEYGCQSEYLWACTVMPVCAINADDIIERIVENAYEDFDPDDLDGVGELQKACKAFNDSNKQHVKWEPDYELSVIDISASFETKGVDSGAEKREE